MSTLSAAPLDRPFEAFHILIAEDDDSLRQILTDTLKGPQRVLEPCQDGAEALRAIEKSPFDLIITDLLMAGANGLQVMEEAKRQNPDSVVIIMTGYASLDSAIQAIRGGAYDYIRKPFKIGEMEIVVKNAIEKILLIRENSRLLQKLHDTQEEMSKLRQAWNDKMADLLGNDPFPISPSFSEVDVTLKQVPPDFDLMKKDFPEKAIQELERLIRLRKEGHIAENEFYLLKRGMLKKLTD